MNTATSRLKTLVRAEPAALTAWLRQPPSFTSVAPLLLAIIVGCAAYGFSIGLWRSPLQAVYVAIKMPLLIFLTLLVNGFLNGMLALLLGTGLSFRQTLMACLMSFAIFALIVGSLSPIAVAMVLDAPSPEAPEAVTWYRLLLLMHTAIIAFAGIIANHKLLCLLQNFAGNAAAGTRVLIVWLAGNLFVGAQLSYNLRPFFGNPDLPVQFVRPHPFDGNFYEAVGSTLRASLPNNEVLRAGLLTLLLVMFLIALLITHHKRSAAPNPQIHPIP